MMNLLKLFFCGFLIAFSFNLQAQDRFFAFTAQSNVLPKGTRAVEIWYTGRTGGQVFYNANLTRVGLKLGLGNNIMTQFYANLEEYAEIASEISHLDQKTRLYSQTDYHEVDVSFSNETKIKLLDPIANGIGMAIYNELTFGSHFRKITPRLILDKRIGDNFFVFNALVEFSKTSEGTISKGAATAPTIIVGKEQTYELGLAYLHFSKNNKFGIGFEVRNHNEVSDYGGWEHSALFAGPAVHFSDDKWFINMTALPQITNLKKSWLAPDNLVLDEHQRFEFRAQLGFMF